MNQLAILSFVSLLNWVAARNLEDGSSSYSVRFDRCFGVKIPNEEDQEGNSYFYNGSYRSQSKVYASFNICEDGCDTCDTSTGYVTELGDFLDAGINYAQEYCNSCLYQCRRFLEEEGGENENDYQAQQIQVDCNACSNVCYGLNNQGDGGNDETQYLNCQAAYADDDIQYYAGPGCSDGEISVQLYYDEDCTIRAGGNAEYSQGFAYGTFRAIEAVCSDCSQSDVCDQVGESYQCIDGVNANENMDDSYMKVCKAHSKATKEWSYAKAKRNSPLPFILFFVFVIGMFCSLTYVYFVRHKKVAIAKEELLEGATVPQSADGEYVGML